MQTIWQEHAARKREEATIFWPAQCGCGHIFLEKYQFEKPNENGEIGFAWCGFCRTKRMVMPANVELRGAATRTDEQTTAL